MCHQTISDKTVLLFNTHSSHWLTPVLIVFTNRWLKYFYIFDSWFVFSSKVNIVVVWYLYTVLDGWLNYVMLFQWSMMWRIFFVVVVKQLIKYFKCNIGIYLFLFSRHCRRLEKWLIRFKLHNYTIFSIDVALYAPRGNILLLTNTAKCYDRRREWCWSFNWYLSKLHHFNNTNDISNNFNKCKTAFQKVLIEHLW